MEKIEKWQPSEIKVVLTDIDDTLTHQGRLQSEAYNALWQLHEKGILVIPVTGRPAGWCELIARQWPVYAVVGENGGFYFRYHQKNKQMMRNFYFSQEAQIKNRLRLDQIRKDILKQVPNARVASDQFSRLIDLAIDFREDVTPLSKEEIDKIVDLFSQHGAQAKVSSIHVNGWYGDYNKLSMCQTLLKNELSFSDQQIKTQCAFIGDSPNDEQMFEYFENSVAVKNLTRFSDQLKFFPRYLCEKEGGLGFAEFASRLLTLN